MSTNSFKKKEKQRVKLYAEGIAAHKAGIAYGNCPYPTDPDIHKTSWESLVWQAGWSDQKYKENGSSLTATQRHEISEDIKARMNLEDMNRQYMASTPHALFLERQNVYSEGKVAFVYGKKEDDNPFPTSATDKHTQDLHDAWLGGWHEEWGKTLSPADQKRIDDGLNVLVNEMIAKGDFSPEKIKIHRLRQKHAKKHPNIYPSLGEIK